MTLNWVFVIELLVISLPLFSATKYNVSLEDVETYDCKNYTTQDSFTGYKEKFFEIEHFQHAQKHGDDLVNLDVFVLADDLASILLSTTERPGDLTPAYEITIASDDFDSRISNAIYGTTLVRQRTMNILSPTDPLPLNIRVSKEGEISAKINGMDKIVIEASVIKPLPIRYIAFSALSSLKANWFFDCKKNIYKDLGLQDTATEEFSNTNTPQFTSENITDSLNYGFTEETSSFDDESGTTSDKLDNPGSTLLPNRSEINGGAFDTKDTNRQFDNFLFRSIFYLFCFIAVILVVFVVIKKLLIKRQTTRAGARIYFNAT